MDRAAWIEPADRLVHGFWRTEGQSVAHCVEPGLPRRSALRAHPSQSGEQRLDERVGIEREKVTDLLPYPHELNRDPEGRLDGEHDPTLGR